MKLRPHHLLCTRGYVGKGYSDDFVRNMTRITERLWTERDLAVNIVFSTDDICAHCPRMICHGCCKDDAQIRQLDQKVVDYFGLEEKCYRFQDLMPVIYGKISADVVHDICAHCGWYHISVCKDRIIDHAGQVYPRGRKYHLKRCWEKAATLFRTQA